MSGADTTPLWLDLGNGERIAYRKVAGSEPGVMFLGGYMSDMTGTKASWLDARCRANGRAFLRFDYTGHGSSTGAFEDGTISSWTRDALAVLNTLADGRQILVGSSMGGWIMLNLALRRPEKVHALVGIAAAPDFSQDIWWNLTPGERRSLERDGRIEIEEDGGSLPVTNAFVRDGRDRLVLRGPVDVAVPVRLLQGMRDEAVPWRTAIRIAERVRSEDVEVHLVKDGDHRLSRDKDLARLAAVIERLPGVGTRDLAA